MSKKEKTSPNAAKIAGKVLSTGKATKKEIATLAATALTQAADKKKRR